jgi:predicted ABC-type transport system involved in lysophospholipase L1 biosynthesis ATPase subunit
VADHLRLGARLYPGWDATLAERRIAALGLDPHQKAGRLSGGQCAQLAPSLAPSLAAAKRPELLVFDEPVAALDLMLGSESVLRHADGKVFTNGETKVCGDGAKSAWCSRCLRATKDLHFVVTPTSRRIATGRSRSWRAWC